MKKIMSAIAAAAVTGVFALGAVAPASAQSVGFSFSVGSDRDRADRAFRRYCEDYPRDRDCRRFLRGQFRDADYYNFYRSHRRGLDPIAGVFGFTLGTIFAAAAANAADRYDDEVDFEYDAEHVARCEARFRSYDRDTDQYLGYDGEYHYCTL